MDTRYRSMESVAGTTFFIAFAVAIASHLFFHPSLLLYVGGVGAGGFSFLCWRASLARSERLAAMLAAFSVLAVAASLLAEAHTPLTTLLVVGLSHFGATLFGLVAVAKLLHPAARQ